MKSRILTIIVIFLLLARNIEAQSIYAGGNEDGFSSSPYTQADNPLLAIFSGGDADGFAVACYTQADNPLLAIFSGGDADGFAAACYTQADNPLLAIFSGGDADGFAAACYTQADNPLLAIFSGGDADGFAAACYTQADNPLLAIFSGGDADGFAAACYTQADNPLLAIFSGGDADGFAAACYTQADNPLLAIFSGGDADGFAAACYRQADNPFLAIFAGGNDDGFSFSCVGRLGAEVPLPIEILDFNAKTKEDWVLLDWSTASEKDNDFFIVEKSQMASEWVVLSTVTGLGYSSTVHNYKLVDKEPFPGISYYRLKQTDFNGAYSYSPIRVVRFKNKNNSKILIYPNPAKDQLTIQGDEEELSFIRIYNVLGQNLSSFITIKEGNKTNKVIDLSNLVPGLYHIKTKTITSKVYKE